MVAGVAFSGQNARMPLRHRPLGIHRRSDDALRAGDQAFGAVVLRGELIVAIRDAARRLRTRDLSGCVLVSTSRPCRMCEAAAGWAGISRMVYGEASTDAGAPR